MGRRPIRPCSRHRLAFGQSMPYLGIYFRDSGHWPYNTKYGMGQASLGPCLIWDYFAHFVTKLLLRSNSLRNGRSSPSFFRPEMGATATGPLIGQIGFREVRPVAFGHRPKKGALGQKEGPGPARIHADARFAR